MAVVTGMMGFGNLSPAFTEATRSMLSEIFSRHTQTPSLAYPINLEGMTASREEKVLQRAILCDNEPERWIELLRAKQCLQLKEGTIKLTEVETIVPGEKPTDQKRSPLSRAGTSLKRTSVGVLKQLFVQAPSIAEVVRREERVKNETFRLINVEGTFNDEVVNPTEKMDGTVSCIPSFSI